MVATGGIYCQFKQAEYILEDFKAEVKRIHATGEAERDVLEAQYLAESAQQIADVTAPIAKKQQELQRLLDTAALLVRRASGASTMVERASTLRPVSGRSARVSVASKLVNGPSPATDHTIASGMLKPIGLSQQAADAHGQIQATKDQTDARAAGPFATAGQDLDRLTKQAASELRKGFDSELFGPLVAMTAGLPPPDPLTLVAAMNFSKLELLRILKAKTDWLNGIRARHGADLTAQAEALGEQSSILMAALESAIKRAMLLIAALKDALDSPSQATQDVLAAELAAAKADQTVADPRATLVAPASSPQRWRQSVAATGQVDTAFKGAIAAAQATVPKPSTPAELSTLALSARATVRDLVGKGTVAQLEADVHARFSNDEKTLNEVLRWIKSESTGLT